jgi:hypothetical protein
MSAVAAGAEPGEPQLNPRRARTDLETLDRDRGCKAVSGVR